MIDTNQFERPRDTVLEPVGVTGTPEAWGGRRGPLRGGFRFRPALAMALVAIGFFALCLGVSERTPWDADTSAVFLQGWDLVHGHILLHGWWGSDVDFYTFDMPIYGLCGLVFGMGDTALHVAGVVIYTLVFLSAVWASAKSEAKGAAFWLRVAVLVFCMSASMIEGALSGTLLLVPDHMGTMVFIFTAFVLYARHAETRWGPWVLLVVLTLGQLGDATVRYVAVPAIALVWAAGWPFSRRAISPKTWTKAWMVLAAGGSVVLSLVLREVEKSMGAYYLTAPKSAIAPVKDWSWHFTGTLESLLSIFGVPVNGFPGGSAKRDAITFAGGTAFVLGTASLLLVIATWKRRALIDRLLAVGFLVYLAAYCFSSVAVHGGGGGYEFVGVEVVLAALSARNISRLRMPRSRALSERGAFRATVAWTAAAFTAAALCLLSGTALVEPTVRDPSQSVALWLEQNGYRHGLADYWAATPMTVYSGDTVQVRAILTARGFAQTYDWGSKTQWYDPASVDADFVVTGDGTHGLTVADAESAFGTPARVIVLNRYRILVYDYNLLTRVRVSNTPPGA